MEVAPFRLEGACRGESMRAKLLIKHVIMRKSHAKWLNSV